MISHCVSSAFENVCRWSLGFRTQVPAGAVATSLPSSASANRPPVQTSGDPARVTLIFAIRASVMEGVSRLQRSRLVGTLAKYHQASTGLRVTDDAIPAHNGIFLGLPGSNLSKAVS